MEKCRLFSLVLATALLFACTPAATLNLRRKRATAISDSLLLDNFTPGQVPVPGKLSNKQLSPFEKKEPGQENKNKVPPASTPRTWKRQVSPTMFDLTGVHKDFTTMYTDPNGSLDLPAKHAIEIALVATNQGGKGKTSGKLLLDSAALIKEINDFYEKTELVKNLEKYYDANKKAKAAHCCDIPLKGKVGSAKHFVAEVAFHWMTGRQLGKCQKMITDAGIPQRKNYNQWTVESPDKTPAIADRSRG